MSNRLHLIALDARSSGEGTERFKKWLRSKAPFDSWWNHLPFVFLVEADMDAEKITDLVKPILDEERFLVLGVDLEDSNGILGQRAWDWISKRESAGSVAEAEQ